MGTFWSGGRAWVARRLVVSAFLAVHIGATLLWVLPGCPLRTQMYGAITWYIVPLGFWQFWGMFAPDPPTNVLALDAEAVDAHGLRYNFAFPRQADYSILGAVPRFRHSKFVMNLASPDPEVELQRMAVARHVLRRLALPADAYPVDVHLAFQVRLCPPPGQSARDAPTRCQPYPFASFHFDRPERARP